MPIVQGCQEKSAEKLGWRRNLGAKSCGHYDPGHLVLTSRRLNMGKIANFEGLCGKYCRGSLIGEEEFSGRGDGEL